MVPGRTCYLALALALALALRPWLEAQLASDSAGKVVSRSLALHRPVASGTTWHSGPVPQAPLSSWPQTSKFISLSFPVLQLPSPVLTGSRLAQS